MNRVQVVLSGFSKRLSCFVQAKTLCRYGCVYCWLHSCLCVYMAHACFMSVVVSVGSLWVVL